MTIVTVPRRYSTIDLLRVVAIAMTMLTHTPSIHQNLPVVRTISHGLWLGVDLFMLISGWLLGGQLLRETKGSETTPMRFYVKRWMRTLPPYYFMLLVLYFGGSDQFHRPLPTDVILSHLAFLQGYTTWNRYMVSWSLCVEEHFYLLLPLIVALLLRWPRKRTALAIVILAELVSVALRSWIYYTEPGTGGVPALSVLRCHGLFVGILLAWVNLERPDLWQRLGRWANVSLGLGVLCTLLAMASIHDTESAWQYIIMPTLGTWTLTLAFYACVHESSAASRIDFRGLQYMGGLTYAMYLTHTVIPRAWLGGQGAGSVLAAVWRLVLVLALSVALHHLVEKPALRVRNWLMRRWRPYANKGLEPVEITL